MSISQDLKAINTYMVTTEAKTSKATVLKDSWLEWFDHLGFWDLQINDKNTYDEARNRRNAFNSANATTQEEKVAAKTQAAKGFTTEEMQGGDKRISSKGVYQTEDKPLIPTEYKIYAGVAVVGTILIFSYGLAGALPTALAGLFGRYHRKEV